MATTGYQAAIATNDVLLSYAPESTWGSKPAVQFQQIRIESEGFAGTKSRTRPSEINASGQVSAAVTTKVETKGDMKLGLSTATPFNMLAASFAAAPATAINFSAKTTVAATGTGFTDSGSGFVTAGIAAGQWIRVSGFATTSINGYYQVLTVAAGTITTLPAPATTELAGASVTFTGQMARQAQIFQSFFVQKQLSSNKFLHFAGSWPTGGGISASVGGFFESTLSFLCKDQVKATSDGSTGAQLAAGSGNVIDTVGGFGSVYRGATLLDATINKIDVKWQQQSARAIYGMGSAAALGMGKGLIEVTGSIELYFKDFAQYDEFISETASMISFRGVDATGAGYIVSIANATIMNPKITAGGPNQDVMATFDLEGNPSATGGVFAGACMQIDKVT